MTKARKQTPGKSRTASLALALCSADRLRDYIKDRERLDWLVANSAYVAHARDGEVCWVMMRPDEESDFETVANTTCLTARESVDAAMRGPNVKDEPRA